MQGDVQTVQIAVVGIVYQGASTYAGFHLQAHSHRLQFLQSLLYHLVAHSHVLTHHFADSLVVVDGISCAMPGNQLRLKVHLSHTLLNQLVISWVY